MNYLTNSDVAILRQMVADYLNRSLNQPIRLNPDSSYKVGEDQQAPDVYVAYPQTSDGIPALLPAGTGTGTDVSGSAYDEPGKAECDIYQVITNDTTGDPELHAVPGFSQIVYNLSSAALDQDWLLVSRTKYGKWFAVTAEGGEEIEVVIDYRVNTTDLTLEKKTRTIRVIPVGDESDWTVVHEGVDCSETGTGTGT